MPPRKNPFDAAGGPPPGTTRARDVLKWTGERHAKLPIDPIGSAPCGHGPRDGVFRNGQGRRGGGAQCELCLWGRR
eukprot:1930327-Pyramimonas_sp.AAC.1